MALDYNKIKTAAQGYEKDMTKFLRDIVKFPGESCDEKAHINRIAEEMRKLDFNKVEIDPMTEEQAKQAAQLYGYVVKEDAGRGFRRVVASPKPQEIIEIDAIRSLVESGQLVIACGGGGIPVTRRGNHLKGASAVIDKDFASELLAEELDADYLIILTAVEKVAINFGKPEEKWLDNLTTTEALRYMDCPIGRQPKFVPSWMCKSAPVKAMAMMP